MAKPRIIIADTDVNYIMPLQLKFVENFFEKVDLEIITDADYMKELFSTPQRVDILVISEDLYDQALQRHSITKIFLMTEQYEEEGTADLRVIRMFKYTSIKEIYNEITGKSAEILRVKTVGKKETEIVLVYSACGGTGKTTVALGISACLTKNYKKVLYINADYLQSFQYLLENSTPISASDVYAKLSNSVDCSYMDIKHVIRKELFSYVPPFKAALMSLGLQYSVYEKLAVMAKKTNEYDYIIIDAEAAFDEEKARLLNLADKVIIVTNQTRLSVCATNHLVANINGVNDEKYIFVCNDFDKEAENALIASDINMKFTVSEYIDHFGHYERMKLEEFTRESGIQKVSFLII